LIHDHNRPRAARGASRWMLIAVVAGFACAAPALFAASQAASPPDLTGVWITYRASGDIGRASADINSTWPRDPPFTPEGKKKTQEYRELVEPTGDTPGGWCVVYGMPGAMLGAGAYPMEFIQRPEQITIIYEAHTEVRRIYMNVPPPDPRDLIPSRDGTSTGRWEGDTLVVETIGLKEAVDQTSAHSEEAKIVERYRLAKGPKGETLLTGELTLTDPRFYTRPITVSRTWQKAENLRMMPYDCTEPAWNDHLEKLRKQKEDAAR
jgi:hypothetical protein